MPSIGPYVTGLWNGGAVVAWTGSEDDVADLDDPPCADAVAVPRIDRRLRCRRDTRVQAMARARSSSSSRFCAVGCQSRRTGRSTSLRGRRGAVARQLSGRLFVTNLQRRQQHHAVAARQQLPGAQRLLDRAGGAAIPTPNSAHLASQRRTATA
jgi:hypothetical protein